MGRRKTTWSARDYRVRNLPPGAALLFVAHPGHELRVYGWLAIAQPLVLILTDGSGRSGHSRVPSTLATLSETGAEAGGWCGELADSAAYTAILESDLPRLTGILDVTVATLLDSDIAYVVGDAIEGYNPVHDVCRLLINAAVEIVRRRGRTVQNFEFPLVGRPDACDDHLLPLAVEIALSDELLRRKLDAARRDPDLAIDVDEALAVVGPDAFRVEVLRPAAPGGPSDNLPNEPPYYERIGEERVSSGRYDRVLRRAQVLRIAEGIWRHVETQGR